MQLTQNLTNGAEIRLRLYMTSSRNNMYQRTTNDRAFSDKVSVYQEQDPELLEIYQTTDLNVLDAVNPLAFE
jgi:hypothetical protein